MIQRAKWWYHDNGPLNTMLDAISNTQRNVLHHPCYDLWKYISAPYHKNYIPKRDALS